MNTYYKYIELLIMTYTTLTIIATYFNIQSYTDIYRVIQTYTELYRHIESYTDIYRVIRIYYITGFFQGQHILQISRNLGQFVKITDTEKKFYMVKL